MKINTNVAVRHNGSYVTISVRDFYSFFCIVYTERFVAMDLIVRETFVLAEAASLAGKLNWGKVLFERDSLMVCKDVISLEPSQLWAASGMVNLIRECLIEHKEWKVALILRKCNEQAHLLAKWAARFGIIGSVWLYITPEHIRICDMHW